MTNTFKLSLAAFVAAFCVSGAAQAESITVSCAGKTPQAVRVEVHKTAEQVCRTAIAADAVEQTYGSMDECVGATEAAALSAAAYGAQASLKASAPQAIASR